jgi:hypothetical protein
MQQFAGGACRRRSMLLYDIIHVARKDILIKRRRKE